MSDQPTAPAVASPSTPGSNQKFDHPSCKVLVTGNSGTGKTTLFERLVRAQKAQWKFVYDHQGEFQGRFGIPAVSTPAALEEKTIKKGWVVFDPVEMFEGRNPEGFEFFAEYVFMACKEVRGRKLFCSDELQFLIDSRQTPQPFLAICEAGRRYQIDVFAISQAPNLIHNRVRNQLTEVYTFQHTDENALKYLTDNGFDGDAVRNLRQYEYLYRNLRTGETRTGRETL